LPPAESFQSAPVYILACFNNYAELLAAMGFSEDEIAASASLPMVIGNSFFCGIESFNDERVAAAGHCNE
jgi:hypothetical protein